MTDASREKVPQRDEKIAAEGNALMHEAQDESQEGHLTTAENLIFDALDRFRASYGSALPANIQKGFETNVRTITAGWPPEHSKRVSDLMSIEFARDESKVKNSRAQLIVAAQNAQSSQWGDLRQNVLAAFNDIDAAYSSGVPR